MRVYDEYNDTIEALDTIDATMDMIESNFIILGEGIIYRIPEYCDIFNVEHKVEIMER